MFELVSLLLQVVCIFIKSRLTFHIFHCLDCCFLNCAYLKNWNKSYCKTFIIRFLCEDKILEDFNNVNYCSVPLLTIFCYGFCVLGFLISLYYCLCIIFVLFWKTIVSHQWQFIIFPNWEHYSIGDCYIMELSSP